jgi:phosphate transport system substrate-binding protein
MLYYETPGDKVKAKTMVEFMKWAYADGQKFTGDLGYAPLPAEVSKLAVTALAKIKVQ